MSDLLKSLRVLDLTDERGLLAGRILADLGAEVVQIEPPGGSPARRRGPFRADSGDPEDSLFWWAYARGKRSVVLDLENERDREKLRELADGADFLIESNEPGVLAKLGLGYEDLSERNPAVIYVSITAFGQDGPKARSAASDLTVLASASPLILAGDEQRGPVRCSMPQAFLHAAADAAVGALAAHHERVRSGHGQHVEVSAQQSAAIASQFHILSTRMGSPEVQRSAVGVKFGPIEAPLVWRAKDGYVSLLFQWGSALGPFSVRLMKVVHERGFCDEATRDKDWIGYTELLLSGAEPLSEYERVRRIVETFTAAHTKRELLDLALERSLLFAPVSTMEDIVSSAQLAAREWFQEIEHPEHSRSFRYPGAFARFSATPLRPTRRAPKIGEHRAEVLAERRRAPSPPNATAPKNGEAPLEGIKVADFMWVMAGPASTRMLVDLGATVVRVESPTRIDTARTQYPFPGGLPSPDGSGLFANCNAGKLGIALDLKNPAAREVALDLARWADVVTESFSPKAMRGWGLAYEDLRKVKPDLIMVSSSLMGQTGPLSRLAGYGTMGGAIAGFSNLTGWPDRPPISLFGAYTDYVSPRFTAAAILAALEHRRRTGEGQYIDVAQTEAAMHFLAPMLLDFTVNGREGTRRGNSDPHIAPHGVYPAAGDDRWVAIACRSDDEWRALAGVIGRADLGSDRELATAAGRLARSDELDRAVGEWTRLHESAEIEERLQAAGVPAHRVQHSTECLADPQLLHRGHFVERPHPVLGTQLLEGPRWVFSRTPARVRGAAPTLGQHNQQVFEEILGYDEDRITALIAAGALG